MARFGAINDYFTVEGGEISRSFLVQVLGVTDKAASQEIIKNYRKLAQQVKEITGANT